MDRTRYKRIICVGIILMSSFFLSGFKKMQATTENGLFDISVEFSDPLKVGRNTMELTVGKNGTGTAREEKLSVEVAPWMPTHQHGSSEAPLIKEIGKGRFLIEKLNFTMPGKWEVYIRINDGKNEDTAVVSVDVR